MVGLDRAVAAWPGAEGRSAAPPDLVAALPQRWQRVAGWLPGVSELVALYPAFRARPERLAADRALATLDISWTSPGGLSHVPSSGPLVVIANHPFGILDGLVLTSLVGRRRADARVLATSLLGQMSDFRDDLILVDIFGGRRAVARNARALREAIRWVRSGHSLLVFPSGAVSHFQPSLAAVADPAWHPSMARLARLTGAPVVPCFIDGSNSALFHAAGLVHPGLRTLMLPRELARRRHQTVTVHVGRPFLPVVPGVIDDLETTADMRRRCYALEGTRRRVAAPAPAPTAAAPSLDAEAARLSESQALVSSRQFTVFWGAAPQMPGLLKEIGRLRALTFGAAGEGTGQALDLDRFDDDYLHLCLWDLDARRLVGAYRMGRVEPDSSPQACYTHTLFRYDGQFARALAPALELGRAFIVPDYQKQRAPLMLLWSGIARFVVLNPRYRYLFGAVSISPAYSERARHVITQYLTAHAWAPELAGLVQPRHPLATGRTAQEIRSTLLQPDAAGFDRAVAAADAEGKGVPVLLRHYLKLNARALSFSVDPAFGGVLDALVVVDLLDVPSSVLGRYMGEQGARDFLAFHGALAATRPFAADVDRLSA